MHRRTLVACAWLALGALGAAGALGCAEEYRSRPPAGMPPIVAGVRERFAKHWPELTADSSPAAARTRAEVVAWATEDHELMSMLVRNETLDAVVARGIADATKATAAFPDAPDTWLALARLEAYAGHTKAAENAACRARDLDASNTRAWSWCRRSPFASNDRLEGASASDTSGGATGTSGGAKSAGAPPRVAPSDDAHVALRVAERSVPRVCEKRASDLGWAELVACGDLDARTGRRSYARQKYRAAALGTTNDEAQFLALQRLEELDGTCRSVLEQLPEAQAAKYWKWKTTLGAKIRPPLGR